MYIVYAIVLNVFKLKFITVSCNFNIMLAILRMN